MKMLLTTTMMAGALMLSMPAAYAGPGMGGGMKQMFKNISPEGKASVKEIMQGSREAMKANREKVHALRKSLPALVREGKDVSGVFSEIGALTQANQKQFQDNFAAAVAKLSAEDRAKVADAMEEGMKKMEERRAKRQADREARKAERGGEGKPHDGPAPEEEGEDF